MNRPNQDLSRDTHFEILQVIDDDCAKVLQFVLVLHRALLQGVYLELLGAQLCLLPLGEGHLYARLLPQILNFVPGWKKVTGGEQTNDGKLFTSMTQPGPES